MYVNRGRCRSSEKFRFSTGVHRVAIVCQLPGILGYNCPLARTLCISEDRGAF
jgi:hypothetical protein